MEGTAWDVSGSTARVFVAAGSKSNDRAAPSSTCFHNSESRDSISLQPTKTLPHQELFVCRVYYGSGRVLAIPLPSECAVFVPPLSRKIKNLALAYRNGIYRREYFHGMVSSPALPLGVAARRGRSAWPVKIWRKLKWRNPVKEGRRQYTLSFLLYESARSSSTPQW